ncbi:uncharacterized protein N7483_007300 [Penicillium malachiteum]|uniref:uncharacterized protein n=1 Tax=Penicillium malachiteum TaxID=1324776 RepID=UPI0025498D93|nr:uncharacterized protein N7483_007300 [Penicillium malachiteum]KAJ5725943.1 hypothetical protein N7483_007300 [Penicillium malachiteum]
MNRQRLSFNPGSSRPQRPWGLAVWATGAILLGLLGLGLGLRRGIPWRRSSTVKITHPRATFAHKTTLEIHSPYGRFPEKEDSFHFIPCTNSTFPPTLEDDHPQKSWAALFDHNPDHWDWGKSTSNNTIKEDPYAGRGIYLCGYLDVPLDYVNNSDTRIVRLAITKFQVRGLARLDSSRTRSASSNIGRKTERTIIIQPGGPGNSGTLVARRDAEEFTNRFSDGELDVLGWDPRGVNISQPSLSCFPHDAIRDRWTLLTNQYREESSPVRQLEISDAMNNATFYAFWKRFGDFGRFIGTASVVRDLEEIRKRLGEDEVTGYFVSYGTAIAQTYANMFPENVGRMILDGNIYVKDFRVLGGAGWTLLENDTDVWRDGFLGECINAGPQWCALAKTTNDESPVTLEWLEARLAKAFNSLIDRPLPAYTDKSGPSIITYSQLVDRLRQFMYDPKNWPDAAQMLYELEKGNTTLVATYLDSQWGYKPWIPSYIGHPLSDKSMYLIICADIVDATPPDDGLSWWNQLWLSMTRKSWLSGNMAFYWVLPCQHYAKYWSTSSEVYLGDLNHTFRTPVLLMSTTYDPATPLRNGRRLLHDMGHNARLVVHHGYGHTTINDRSKCTDRIGKAYILNGSLPSEQETDCFANRKPYIGRSTNVSSHRKFE